jgi:predicted phage terminase large subunit-like protein
MSDYSLKQAAREIMRRRELRNNLVSWCRKCGFEPARHHRLLLSKLEAVAHGKLDRLAVFMPPGSAKSTYASVLFPPWYYSLHPDHSMIAGSHTAELAEKWGRRVRNLISEHHELLGVDLALTNQSAGRWETTRGGEYFAAGVTGGIAGWRGDLVVIDDPVRSREDAESAIVRDKTWDWYRSDVYPRLKPHGRIVLIQTRWHEDDLAGRILMDSQCGGDQWEVINLPALAEHNDPLGRQPGEALWPEWEDVDQLERKRRAIGTRDWNALFQQRPAPEEGDYFKNEWLKPVTTLPSKELLRVYGGSDYAVTEKGGDYTVHAVVGVDPDNKMYLLDIWRDQASSDRWVEAFCDLVIKWKPMGWAEEQGQIRSGIGPYLDRRQRERNAYVARQMFPTRGDKAIRAQSIRGRMALEGLYVPEFAAWYPLLRSELLSFPSGAHDDQVDALGLVGQLLDIMLVGRQPEPPPPPRFSSGYSTYRRNQPGDWRTY